MNIDKFIKILKRYDHNKQLKLIKIVTNEWFLKQYNHNLFEDIPQTNLNIYRGHPDKFFEFITTCLKIIASNTISKI